MAKDYAKFVPSRPKQLKKPGWRRAIIPGFALLIMLGVISGYFVYQKKSSATLAENPKVNAFFNKITTLLGHHKKASSPAVSEKTKALASEQSDQAPAVQFDFYSELPTLQVALPQTVATTPPPLNKSMSKISTSTMTPVSNTAVETVQPRPETAAAPSTVSKPEELTSLPTSEQKVAATKIAVAKIKTVAKVAVNNSDQYLLHLGSFETQKAAKLWYTALLGVGFQAKIIQENYNGRMMYHVRQGPFASLALAKMAQQKLLKRGITSHIIKKV